MKSEVSPEHLTEALARAHQHWETQRADPSLATTVVPTKFSIAISREAGSYGSAMARALGERLSWPVYDAELLRRIADDLGVRQTLLKSLDEKQVGWISDCMTGLFSGGVSQSAYFRHLVELLLSLANHGECIVVGRGAPFVMPFATTLRVRVVAPVEHRVQAIQREQGVSLKEATSQIATTDKERNRFVEEHFRVDPKDPANYDLVLNAARFSQDECADFIIAVLNRLKQRARK